VFISPDHQLKAADDLTDSAIGMSTARNLGLGDWNMGIGVAVIDSGINDTHDDLRNTVTQSRVFYHQDFTGTSVHDSSGALVYDNMGTGRTSPASWPETAPIPTLSLKGSPMV
jgi:subtilisin family serine protease